MEGDSRPRRLRPDGEASVGTVEDQAVEWRRALLNIVAWDDVELRCSLQRLSLFRFSGIYLWLQYLLTYFTLRCHSAAS